ncbi:MAG: type II secretion system inner membrane protein GspF [Desulfobacterales bacterium]|nr:type II secretion system inner membrane protein GspF [Desulfobacterales bacterium]
MPIFAYKATDHSGKIISGTLDALEEKGVVRQLQDMGLIPIKIGGAEGNRKGLGFLSADIASMIKRVSTKDVMVFTQDLSALLEAGLPVDRALAILIDAAENDKFKEVIGEVLKAVQGGGYLSDALAKYPKSFSTFYVNMVRAGESGGVLEDVLTRLGMFLETTQDLKDYIKSAMVYPLFLVFVGGASIIVLLTFVIPKFSVIFSDMGQSLPLSTQIMLSISQGIRSYWWIILLVLGTAFYFLRRYVKTPAGRLKMDQYRLGMPIGGTLIKNVEMARFSRTLGTLTKSGVPILQALTLVKDVIGNSVIAGTLEQAHERVKEGERLSRPLSEAGMFPSLAVQMITVGEETGRMDEMLLRVAENYEKVVRAMIKSLISLLEPAMILAMGLVVAFIVISMLMAIFSMNEMPF